MSDGIAYLVAVVVAMVFVYSAVAKFRKTQPARRALRASGLPSSDAAVKAIAAAEFLTAATLIVRPAAGAVMAIALLSLFTLFIVSLMVRNIDVSCGCFGANDSDSVSAVDVFRNGLLIVAAVMAISVGRPSTFVIEEFIVVTTAAAIGVVLLTAMAIRKELGQLFDNRLPGGL